MTGIVEERAAEQGIRAITSGMRVGAHAVAQWIIQGAKDRGAPAVEIKVEEHGKSVVVVGVDNGEPMTATAMDTGMAAMIAGASGGVEIWSGEIGIGKSWIPTALGGLETHRFGSVPAVWHRTAKGDAVQSTVGDGGAQDMEVADEWYRDNTVIRILLAGEVQPAHARREVRRAAKAAGIAVRLEGEAVQQEDILVGAMRFGQCMNATVAVKQSLPETRQEPCMLVGMEPVRARMPQLQPLCGGRDLHTVAVVHGGLDAKREEEILNEAWRLLMLEAMATKKAGVQVLYQGKEMQALIKAAGREGIDEEKIWKMMSTPMARRWRTVGSTWEHLPVSKQVAAGKALTPLQAECADRIFDGQGDDERVLVVEDPRLEGHHWWGHIPSAAQVIRVVRHEADGHWEPLEERIAGNGKKGPIVVAAMKAQIFGTMMNEITNTRVSRTHIVDTCACSGVRLVVVAGEEPKESEYAWEEERMARSAAWARAQQGMAMITEGYEQIRYEVRGEK